MATPSVEILLFYVGPVGVLQSTPNAGWTHADILTLDTLGPMYRS